MEYRYVYLFTIGGKIVWSATKNISWSYGYNKKDRDLILDFIKQDNVGSFIELSTGEFIFQTS